MHYPQCLTEADVVCMIKEQPLHSRLQWKRPTRGSGLAQGSMKKKTESVNKHWNSAFIKWTSVSLDTSSALYYRSEKSPWFFLRSTFILPPLGLILPMTKSPQLVLIQMVQAAEHPKLEKPGGGGQREWWKRERESPRGKNPFHIRCQIWTKKIWEDILPWTEI